MGMSALLLSLLSLVMIEVMYPMYLRASVLGYVPLV
jgi:hypothetical protein